MPAKLKAKIFCEKVSIYVIIGAVIGARLGHLLFYEPISGVLKDPLSIFRTWEGGLSSHGGVIGILISLWVFSKRAKHKMRSILEHLLVPACFTACFIRFGNFVNQEILGTPTSMPWGVLFLHPADGSAAVFRHPVQIYEALFYLGLGLFLIKRKNKIGLFFTAMFLFRFCIEFFKTKQSLIPGSEDLLAMGQLLSLPLIAIGIYFLIKDLRARLQIHSDN